MAQSVCGEFTHENQTANQSDFSLYAKLEERTMNRNFHNSRGSSTNPRNQNSRWRIILIALLLALAVGTAQLPLAQAADPKLSILAQPTALRASVVYVMNPINPKKTLCFGETVTYTLNVYRFRKSPPSLENAMAGRNVPELYIRPGVRVEATSSETSIGTFARPGYGHTGEEFDGTNNVEFQFTAKKKLGTTNLYFEAVVNDQDGGGYVTSPPVTVKVVPCKFKVKTVLSFNPGIYNIDVISDDAVMTADESGTFTGSTTMHWAYSNFSIPCSVSAADSSVDLTGHLEGDGEQFIGTMTFQPTTVSGCRGSAQGIVNPLNFSVASSGGVSISTATAPPLSGLAHIVVVPDGDTAVSFNPHNLAAQVGSPSIWATESWNNFPWFNNTRLGLYP